MGGVGLFLKDAWRLARPYFASSEERWSARALLATVIGLSLASVGLTVLLNFWRLDFYNALQNKDWDGFVSLLLLYRRTDHLTFGFTPLAMSHVVIAVFEVYLTQWLTIRWRRWLSVKFLNEWMQERAYYKIGLTSHYEIGTDNPDQRISEDIREYCETSLSLTLGLLSRIVTLFSFLTILWGLSGTVNFFGTSIPGDLFFIALIYAIVGTICTHYTGRPLAALVFRQQRVEADFRYGLVRVRENIEGIALYKGEEQETGNLMHRFVAVIGNFRAIMHRTLLLNMVTVGYSQISVIIPFVAAGPAYFTGKGALGTLLQTVEAFGRVESALSWIVDRYDTLASWRAVVERLSTFHRAIEASHAINADMIREESSDGSLRIHDLEVALPDGTKLLAHADVTLAKGQSVIITGRSGVGKSTLFRALSGIWPYARGRLELPRDMFFLPQKPYIPLGTLRYVISYPHAPDHFDRAVLTEVLREVGLSHLVDRLDRDDNWPHSLSGGELQRVAIARALLAKPSWIFLDEATATLDPDSEQEVYQALRKHLPDATFVSIAHRESVAQFHEDHLEMSRSGMTPGTLTLGAGA
jgi:vitamin B12/bleomycin/antimicrobial peptide transport system ATP-binding/permease protein